MRSEILNKFIQITDSVSAANYVVALIFLKWADKKKPVLSSSFFECVTDLNKIIYQDKHQLGETLQKTFRCMEESNYNELGGLFDWLDFSDPRFALGNDRYYYLREIITAIENSEIDERQLLSQIFSQANSPSVETPPSIATLISALVDCHAGESIFDPVCGNGSLLLSCANDGVSISGIERNRSIWFFAKINLIINGFSSINISNSDCFLNRTETSYEVVVGHPPWGLRQSSWTGSAPDLMVTDGNQNALMDYAFILEMVQRMRPETGRAAALVSNGMLTRSGTEAQIRHKLIDANVLDAVIGLPDKIFANTPIGASILLFRAQRTVRDILFVDARAYATQNRSQNTFSSDAIAEIASLVRGYRAVEGRSSMVSVAELAMQEYTINVPRYVSNSIFVEQVGNEDISRRKEDMQREIEILSVQIEELLHGLQRLE